MLIINILDENINKVKIGTVLALFSVFAASSLVSADEIVITGNGNGSVSNINNTQTQNTNISQNNTEQINNEVHTQANTGGNNVSGNTNGINTIGTGNITEEVTIANSGNSNTSNNGCCGTDTSTVSLISDNAAGSDNLISITSLNNVVITANNSANISNNIFGIANTGNNTANHNNSGDVTIKTGYISVSENINNGPLNFNNSTSFINNDNVKNYNLKIEGNGYHSKNILNLNIKDENNIVVNNALDILNKSLWLLNTGYNDASFNTNANVKILTGNIDLVSDINNGPINSNNTEIKCCEENKNPDDGVTPVTPPPAKVETKNSDSKSSDGPSNKEVLVAAVGSILPATGNYTFVMFLIGNVAMFFLGMVLRLRSGRSPGLVNLAF